MSRHDKIIAWIFSTLLLSIGIYYGFNQQKFPLNSQQSGLPIVYAQDSGDPCLSPVVIKSSVSITSITTATTTSIIPVSATTSINVCGYLIVSNSTTTTNTIQFEYGTGAACSSPTVLSSAMPNGVLPLIFTPGSTGTQFIAPSGNGICIVSTVGSTPTITGYMTYVRRGV